MLKFAVAGVLVIVLLFGIFLFSNEARAAVGETVYTFFSEVIQQINFDRSTAVQVSPLSDDELATPPMQADRTPFEIRGSNYMNWNEYRYSGYRVFFPFESVGKAQEYTPFQIRTPSFLPQSTELMNIRIGGLSEDNIFEASIMYDIMLPEGDVLVTLWQLNVGEDSYLDIILEFDMSIVMIGDIEALLTERTVGAGRADELILKNLTWMDNGVLFSLHSSARSSERNDFRVADTMMLITIAESIG